ncbi:PhaM family polyhydroxyalkanoate granule multifunctional regulatory protein [Ideonella sp.]|uniref:PhaM family polyhydroxyalkanoate granule multifunctional regulatory protein n=1 Tax=Ideonella sp. TaxID=1929293 RepID=UPI002B485C14|nr:PhaM family polyhydroxyalkanoate granule multifunctional regulatory protein [Ideonella sp.]HJV68909.1 PhaM family polyhydroxyalkanoate granule multifunctional regulatory protein [Ideonella sp.]
MADAASFTKMVPGFDFLQGLVKNAGAALPNMGQWIAPTLNPEELEKRIEELRTVQFWLEQNARMLGATIQALEVQRMTLSTLKTMNVQMGELRDSIKLTVPGMESMTPAAPAEPPAAPTPAKKAPAKRAASGAKARVETPMGTVDPMQWWGALTKQFTTLAAGAMKDSATDAAKNLAGAMVKQSFDAAGETLKRAVEIGAQVPVKATKVAAKAVEGGVKVASKAAATAGAAKRSTPRKRS